MITHDTEAGDRGRHGDDAGRRVLVVAAERCVGAELIDELRARAGSERTRIRVVAPALMSRLQFWASDETPARDAAAARLQASLAECRAAGVDVEGVIGDGDPLQAIDDEVRLFAPDEIVVATHPEDRENWLEHDLDVPLARTAPYRLIVIVHYVNLPLIQQLAASLAPGGLLVCEEHLVTDEDVIGPTNPAYRVTSGDLLAAVKGLKIHHLEEVLLPQADGRSAALVRLVAGS